MVGRAGSAVPPALTSVLGQIDDLRTACFHEWSGRDGEDVPRRARSGPDLVVVQQRPVRHGHQPGRMAERWHAADRKARGGPHGIGVSSPDRRHRAGLRQLVLVESVAAGDEGEDGTGGIGIEEEDERFHDLVDRRVDGGSGVRRRPRAVRERPYLDGQARRGGRTDDLCCIAVHGTCILPQQDWQNATVHRWVVAGGLVERADALLLVRNRRRDGRIDWSPPGGVVDEGEALLSGLGREVFEETGLRVDHWHGPAYEIEAVAPDMGWHLRVEVHRGIGVQGALALDDPDGIVEAAEYVDHRHLADRLSSSPRWVKEPLLHWVTHRPDRSVRFSYEVRGTLGQELSVERLG